jgi:hypothetical protein
MPEPPPWGELLSTIISNSAERDRIANEIGVHHITLNRWITGESKPRPQNLRQLLHALPRQQRDQLIALMEDDLPGLPVLSAQVMDDSLFEIAYTFIMEVLDTRATMADMLRFWAINRLVLQQALRQLDPERVGMAITVVRCMPPGSDGKIHSLRENIGRGTPPWEGDLDHKAMFLGAESLAGYVVASCRPEAIGDLTKDRTLLPAYQTEHEVSATAHPIMFAGRVAGCLLLSSTQPNYFLSQSRFALINGFANLIALAFEPEEFYQPELIELGVMPPLEVQRSYFASFRQRVNRLLRESTTAAHPLTNTQAEQLVWQELEEILLQLPPQTT